jgi:hypothetical protein
VTGQRSRKGAEQSEPASVDPPMSSLEQQRNSRRCLSNSAIEVGVFGERAAGGQAADVVRMRLMSLSAPNTSLVK